MKNTWPCTHFRFKKKRFKLEYCFTREKEIVFAQQKQSIPMSINQFVEMTVFLCLICFSFVDKMQGFLDESGLYAKIQNGQQKLWENDFWENLTVDSADTLRVKNFVEIALSRSISEINTFLHLMQKFKMAAKSGGKTIFQKATSRLATYPPGQKFRSNRSISLRFRDKRVFAFNTKIKDIHQKWRENDF